MDRVVDPVRDAQCDGTDLVELGVLLILERHFECAEVVVELGQE
ncbi:hypothetical protein [Streptomyces sp. NPDC059639]